LKIASGPAATIFSMLGLGGLICAFPLGYLADRFGRKRLVTGSALLIAIGAVGVYAVGNAPLALIVLTFLFSAGWGIYVDLVSTLGQDSVDDLVAGTVTGWLLLVFNVGAMLGGPLYAGLLPSGFKTAGLTAVGGSAVLSLLLSLFTRPVTESNIVDETAVTTPAAGQ
jgi:ACS family hexuronate transporter-like MFS transporter